MTEALGIRRQSNIVEKLATSKLFWLAFFVFGFSFPIYKSVNRELPAPLPTIKALPNYELTNGFGKPFGSKILKGRVYIANFMTTKASAEQQVEMDKIQKRVRGLGQKVALISFTLDPVNDTPDVLYKYAREKRANPFVWTFLTGEKSAVENLIVEGFGIPSLESSHAEKLVVVDQSGNIRGYYDPTKNGVNQMMIDVGLLVNRKEYLSN
jgi:protein SCO1/2